MTFCRYDLVQASQVHMGAVSTVWLGDDDNASTSISKFINLANNSINLHPLQLILDGTMKGYWDTSYI